MEQSSASPLALVTGASSGIGLELARQFAEHGYDLVIAAEDDGIIDAAEQLRGTGSHVEPIQVDLSTYDGVEELCRRVKSRGRPLDAAAINAGIGSGGQFVETDLQKEITLINLNCTSTVHLSKRILPEMVARGQGRVLYTSSVAGEVPGPYEAVYAASKAFVLSFAEAVHYELKDSGVTITALQPGATETKFFHRAGMDETKVGREKKDDPKDVARDGFEALMKGHDHVVAGSFKNKVQTTMAKVLSDQAGAAQEAKSAKPDRLDS